MADFSKLKIFNHAALSELVEIEMTSESGLVSDLINVYLETCDEFVNKLFQYANANDLRSIEMTAHSLKSSSAVLGLEQVASTAFAIEAAARENVLDQSTIPLLRSQISAARLELENFLRSRSLMPK